MVDCSLLAMTTNGRPLAREKPLVIAMVPREQGITGVHTHVRQLQRYVKAAGIPSEIITPHSWGARPLHWGQAIATPAFALRPLLERAHGPSHVLWYRASHEVLLRRALRDRLSTLDDCVVYAQCPVSARAALQVRRGPHQRVVMAVHFRTSQADEWADKGQIKRGGRVFRQIRSLERDVLSRIDGVVYVSNWARRALLTWLPEAAETPWVVCDNFVTPWHADRPAQARGDLVTVGNLETVKNHRYLLHVLAEAGRLGHRLTLDVLGEGPELNALTALVSELGLADQVRLLGFRRDVRDLLPGYRAYVHASYSESSSLAIIEAMAAGLPIVAGAVDALGELFDDGVEGRYWSLEDSRKAAEVLVEFLGSDARRAEAGRAAAQRFSRDFDANVVAPRLVAFLQDQHATGTTVRGRLSGQA
jgi:glycosyltransferase involved in cell wall biosynthesis